MRPNVKPLLVCSTLLIAVSVIAAAWWVRPQPGRYVAHWGSIRGPAGDAASTLVVLDTATGEAYAHLAAGAGWVALGSAAQDCR
jgi:hypothetical protein